MVTFKELQSTVLLAQEINGPARIGSGGEPQKVIRGPEHLSYKEKLREWSCSGW